MRLGVVALGALLLLWFFGGTLFDAVLGGLFSWLLASAFIFVIVLLLIWWMGRKR
jgi:hypothetical protein